ncbi:MAG: two component transcriptional regulator, winged helix family, partial [Mycobacterium sp.]|nr:two component transcriptional regulator, winged helix family [Mycobacterium sp.]
MRLLIVEDDNRVADALASVMSRHGFTVFRAATGAEALARLGEADVVLLDLGLPDTDGFDVCRRIRAGSNVPVIVVTARAELSARIHGLNLGADDYMVKPVHGAELVARIHAVMRRGRGGAAGAGADGGGRTVVVGPVTIDAAGRTVHLGAVPVVLTRREFDLLAALARQPGLVYRREQLVAEVWGTYDASAERTLEVHIGSLRAKLGDH